MTLRLLGIDAIGVRETTILNLHVGVLGTTIGDGKVNAIDGTMTRRKTRRRRPDVAVREIDTKTMTETEGIDPKLPTDDTETTMIAGTRPTTSETRGGTETGRERGERRRRGLGRRNMRSRTGGTATATGIATGIVLDRARSLGRRRRKTTSIWARYWRRARSTGAKLSLSPSP